MDMGFVQRLGEMAEGLMALVTDLRAEMERETSDDGEGSADPPPEEESRGEESRSEEPKTAPAETMVARAQRIESERIEGEIEALVRDGRLLARDVESAFARMSSGRDLGDLIGDYTCRAPAGRTADDTEAEPRSERTPDQVTATELHATARSEHPSNPTKAHARYMELVSEARANNTLREE